MSAALAQLNAENLGKFCESNDEFQLEVSGGLTRTIKQSYEGRYICRLLIAGPIRSLENRLLRCRKAIWRGCWIFKW